MIPLLNPHSGGKRISMIEFASFGFFGTHSACSLQTSFLSKSNLFPWRQSVSMCLGCRLSSQWPGCANWIGMAGLSGFNLPNIPSLYKASILSNSLAFARLRFKVFQSSTSQAVFIAKFQWLLVDGVWSLGPLVQQFAENRHVLAPSKESTFRTFRDSGRGVLKLGIRCLVRLSEFGW